MSRDIPYWRLSLYYFAYFAFIGAYGSYFALWLQAQGFAPPQIAVLLALMQVMRLFAPFLWGMLADRWRCRRPIVLASAAASLLSFLLVFWWQSFDRLFVVLALLAFCWCAALPLVESLTLAHLHHAPERYGRIRLWGSLGFIVSVLLVGFLLDHVAIDALLWVCALLLAATLVAAGFLPEIGIKHVQAAAVLRLRDLLRRREVLGLLGGCFFMSMAHGPLYVFYSIFLVDHGYSKTVVGTLWSLGVVAEIGIFLYMPALLRHFSIRTLLTASLMAAALRFVVVGWGVSFLALLVAAQLLHAMTFGVCHAVSMAALHRWFPPHLQARAQGLYGSASFGAGGLLGALASGWLWPLLDHAWVYSLASLAALGGLVLVQWSLPE